jgi:general secretion pathway protein K
VRPVGATTPQEFTPHRNQPHRWSVRVWRRQSGAALLLAMLTVTLVATVASAALWQQWRATEIETAERQRQQACWILVGALDWARLILREDARASRSAAEADHLGEPWATPLEEARLSSFLAADRNNNAEDLMQAFLSGELRDQQSRLNVRNLVQVNGQGASARAELSPTDLQAFQRLYTLLNLPAGELATAANQLLRSQTAALSDPQPSASPLLPQRLAHLRWLGMSETSLKALEPHVTVLPERTTLNLNTASAEALSASVPGLDLALARQVVSERAQNPFLSREAAIARISGSSAQTITRKTHDVKSRFFEARMRLRLDDTVIEEHALIQRENTGTRVRWRERTPPP